MRFDSPVTVALGPSGSVQHKVDDPHRAGIILLDQWPASSDTATHRAARRAVLKALQNTHDEMLAAKARKAFERAALEANILRAPDMRPTGGPPAPRWGRKRKLKRGM